MRRTRDLPVICSHIRIAQSGDQASSTLESIMQRIARRIVRLIALDSVDSQQET
jgi:hypothetical protein